ncbi:MAG: hypothetical protein KGL39_20690 [Patescibacteria group bacterium]|nr:hypothetical protein [Patescibacteria group bacterium]
MAKLVIDLAAKYDLQRAGHSDRECDVEAFEAAYREAMDALAEHLGLEVDVISVPDYESQHGATHHPVPGTTDTLESLLWQAAHDSVCGDGGAWNARFSQARADALRGAVAEALVGHYAIAELLHRFGNECDGGSHATSLSIADDWAARGFTSSTAEEWLVAGFWSAVTAASARDAGLSPDEATRALEDAMPEDWDIGYGHQPVYAACNGDVALPW